MPKSKGGGGFKRLSDASIDWGSIRSLDLSAKAGAAPGSPNGMTSAAAAESAASYREGVNGEFPHATHHLLSCGCCKRTHHSLACAQLMI